MSYTTAVINLRTIKERCTIDDDGCWIWARSTIGNQRPYWATRDAEGKRVNVYVPRAVAEEIGRTVPRGKHIKPMCGKDLCVSPDCLHLPSGAGFFSGLMSANARPKNAFGVSA